MPVRAGSLDELRKEGRLLTKVGSLPVVVFWHDGTRVRDRGPLPAPRLPAAPGHGRGRARHLPLAPRPLRPRRRAARSTSGPTTPAASTSTVDGDDVFVARPRRRRSGRRTSSRGCATASRTASRSSSPSRCSACSTPASPARDRAHRRRVRHALPRRGLGRRPHRARRDGQRAPPPRPRRPRARARARPRVRRARHAQPRAALPGRPARRRDDVPVDRLARVVPALRRHPLGATRPSARSTTALAEPGRLGRRRGDDVRGGHRPRLHRRRPHDRLHEQGVRGARPRRARTPRADVLPTLVRRPPPPTRSEEFGEWRHPHDLAALDRATQRPARRRRSPRAPPARRVRRRRRARLAAPRRRSRARSSTRCSTRSRPAPTDEQLGRALAYAAALRIARFHVQNDHGDWDTVHHAFTAAQRAAPGAACGTRRPSCSAALVHGALRVYLDRFLNVPAARLPDAQTGDLDELDECWDVQGVVDEAGDDRRTATCAAAAIPRRAHRGARPRAAARGRRVPLVPGVRGRRRRVLRVARGFRGGVAHPRRRGPVPRRAHADPPRAARGRRIAARLRRGEALYEES